ncbi:MAG: hypothetical protein U0L26_07635 [Cellulosilyticum sp.]|nr:hypothetical protein [Cellulosilyticum sp.]
MPDNTERQLQVGLGFKIEDIGGGLQNLATNADTISKVMKNLAESMGKVEQKSKDVSDSTSRGGRGFSEANKIMNQYKAGLIDSRTATNELIKEQKRLNEELSKVSKGSKEYDSLVSQLANVNKQFEVLTKERISYEKQRTTAIRQENTTRLKEERTYQAELKKQAQDTAKVQRQQLQQVTSAYKQAMNERKVSSQMVGDMLTPTNANFSNTFVNSAIRWTGAYALVHEFQNLGREIVEIEYNTINNMRLMGDFSDELRETLNASAAEIARNTGVMITDAQEIQGAWIRINDEYKKSPELLGEMAEITSKFMNVGEIENAEEAVKLLNSTLLQFNLTGANVAENAEDIANKFAYMADATAMGTADEYAQGIAKMGANVKNMNGDVDDAIVLLSLVGDKLAKNGEEAGNSLNTFTAYMHRAKTINLFDDLQQQYADLDITLRQGENGLKNFEDTLKAIATAYGQLKSEGNELGMNKIIEALGATRQRATAQAILEAISSSDGQNLEYYYELLGNVAAEGNYLEEQNAALMTSLTNQFNSLVVTLQEAGMRIANSGLIDGLTLIMNGFEGLLKVINLVPQPFITGVTAVLAYKTAFSGLNKLGEVTGLTEKLAQMQKFGSQEMMNNANVARQSADAFLNYQKGVFGAESASTRLTKAYQGQLSVLTSYEEGVARANMQLAQTGNVQAYTAELESLKAKYLSNVQAIDLTNLSLEEQNVIRTRNQQITRTDIALTGGEDAMRKASLLTLLKEQGLRKADNLLRKTSIGTKIADKIATLASTAATAAGNVQTKLSTGNTIANTIAKGAYTVATGAATAATTALGVALNFLLSPMVLITAATSLIAWLWQRGKEEAVDYTDSLNSLQDALQSGRERVEELKKAQLSGDVDGSIQQQIDKQNELNESYKRSIDLLQQKATYDKYFGGDKKDNESSKVREHIKVLEDYEKQTATLQKKLDNAHKTINSYNEKVASGQSVSYSEQSAYNSANQAAYDAQERLKDLDRETQASAASLVQYGHDIQKMFDDGLISETDWHDEFEPLVNEINAIDNLIQSFVVDTNESLSSIGFENIEMGDLLNQMDSLAESTKSLVEAQNQLAKGAALSKDHLWELAMQYPELLYQANLFAEGSASGQEAAINAILDMKNQEFNNSIDLKIAELNAEKQFITDVLQLEEQKLNALLQGEAEATAGKYAIKDGELAFLTDFNNLEGQQVTAAEQYKTGKYLESATAKIDAENQANEKVVTGSFEAGKSIATNLIEGSAAGADGAKSNASKVMNVFNTMLPGLGRLAFSIKSALSGDASSIWSNVNTVDGAGDRSNSFNGVSTYKPQEIKIDGLTVTEWIDLQKKQVLSNIEKYTVSLQGIDTAISNLESFKNIGLSGVSNQFSDKGAQGGGGKSEDAAKEAAKAAKDAAESSKDAAEAIEKLTEQYVKNVESMQDRIAKALKKQYQEQYDERKKLLAKEHEERVSQIQAEIDKINGTTPEDKQSELAGLQSKYEQWLKDDSTLGKSKQKEYLDQIKELEKEIKIDELEAKLDKENETYQNSVDKDSEFYDAILKKLDQQMTDEMLYREANDMIRNGKIDEITDLLTKYDAKWDGWATLMGKTAGEIIGDEVALAIANYLDVMNGTVTETGGYYTDKITGGNSSTSSSSGGSSTTTKPSSSTSSGGTVTKGSKVKINDTSAGMYYTSTSGGAVGSWKGYTGTYYVVNTNAGRVALARTNNINGAIGWIPKNKVTKLATGGYTGVGEGLAYLHAKERVLSARQTAAFEDLIYNQLPRLQMPSMNSNGFGGTVNNFNKELVKIDVDTINNYDNADVTNMGDNLDRMFRASLQKAGIRKSR